MTTHTMLRLYRPQRYSISRTAPAQEPVPLEEAKAHARVVDAEEDALLIGYLRAAREVVEDFTQRALITQTYTYKIDGFPAREDELIELPGGKVQSVTSIQYTDTNGATQTWGATNYDADTDWEPARIGLAYDKDWPEERAWGLPVTITYVAGYGDDPGDVPQGLRESILRLALEYYERRQDTDDMKSESIAWPAMRFAYRYRIRKLI